MAINGRIIVDSDWCPPAKFYLHTAGRGIYGDNEVAQVKGASEYVREVLRQPGEARELFYRNWEFILGILWGDGLNRVADVFGASAEGIASGNPGIECSVVREGIARVEKEFSCLEGLRLISAEFGLRMGSSGLIDYMGAGMPDLPFVSGETYHIRL